MDVSRDTMLGRDSTGAEYWLVPLPTKSRGGYRVVAVRNSKKHVPACLQGMWNSGDTAQRAFNDFISSSLAKKKSSKKINAEE